MSEFTNSPLATYINVTEHRTSPRNHAIDTITIHCVVGQCTAKSCVDYFKTTTRDCSSNYVVGFDGSIGISVEEKDRSWCTSSRENDHRAITIEVASDTSEPYAVTDAAYEALIALVADICKRNGIERLVWSTNKEERVNHLNGCNMTVHRDYANKSCPGKYLYDRHGDIAARVNALLKEEEEMTIKCPCCGEELRITLNKVEAEPAPAPTEPVKPREYKVGDIVTFKGDTHYKSADASTGYKCKGGPAEITQTHKGGKHPWHLVRVSGKGATVYGWVDEGSFE